MPDNAADPNETTPEAEGSPVVETPKPEGSTSDELVASYRKRQAGAEAARAAAEAKAAEYEKELAKYRKAAQTDEQKDLSELARMQANLEAAERRAAEAETKAEAKVLDARFPNARKELPEVTDEVRLAKFEALLADDSDEPPTPQRHNESKPNPQSEDKKPESVKDLEARLIATPLGWD
jgi:hypothetical protein